MNIDTLMDCLIFDNITCQLSLKILDLKSSCFWDCKCNYLYTFIHTAAGVNVAAGILPNMYIIQ